MSKVKNDQTQQGPPSDVERIKDESNYLRGTLEESFLDRTSAGISDDDNRLMKFHGSYMQDDRDLRAERQKQKLEPAYQFMVRIRAAGGVVTPEQWLTIDRLAKTYANGSIRLTTRQAIQLHGILKWKMKKSIQEMNESLLDTLAACGDVNRNVMLNPNPYQSKVHAEVYDWATKLSEHLSPKTNAYHEIWLDGEKVLSSDGEQEPIYGKHYLPRKFKIGIAVPPSNDIDVYSQDLGFIAIIEDEKLKGFNISVGGGMGMTHGDDKTYPQIGRVIGFIQPEQLIDVAEKIVTIQRDYGNRSVRKNARFKYTIDARGLDWLKEELEERVGFEISKAETFHFEDNGDRYGWVQSDDDTWHYTLFIQNGRIIDDEEHQWMTGLKEIAHIHTGDFRVTANQNLIIANISQSNKAQIETLLEKYSLDAGEKHSALKRNSMACVAFPTCGLAMAESERYLPSLLKKLDSLLEDAGILEEDITIRMSGCPNGCSRPALAEIGLIGKGPGKYNLYLGGGFAGNRLNKLYRENIDEQQILAELTPLFHAYGTEKEEKEHFGDFLIRKNYIQAVNNGLDFHA